MGSHSMLPLCASLVAQLQGELISLLCPKSYFARPSSSTHRLFSLMALVPQDVIISRKDGSGCRELDKADVGGVSDPRG